MAANHATAHSLDATECHICAGCRADWPQLAQVALQFYPVLGFLGLRFGITFVLLLPDLLRSTRQQQRDALRSGLPLGP